MSKTAWPTEAELTARLSGFGVSSIPTGVTLQDELDAAVGALHKAIRFSPYLAGDPASYEYNPPRSHTLLLGGPFFTITAVKINKNNDYAGDSLTEGVDYWRKPGVPYAYVEFESRQYGDPDSIEVTGKKGVTDNIPVDLWKAVLDYAVAGVLEQSVATGAVSTGPVSKVKQGQMDVEYGTKTEPMFTTLRTRAMEVFKSHRRPALVGASQ